MALRVVGSRPIIHPILDSIILDSKSYDICNFAFVAQLDRASDFGSEG